MKKRVILTTLCIFVLFISIWSMVSCAPKQTKPQVPATTIIQIQTPNQDGQAGTQTSFNYEVLFEPIVEFQGEAFPVKILSTATATTWWDGSPRMVNEEDHIGDLLGDFGVTVSLKGSSEEGIPIKVEIEGDRFIKKSSLDVVIPTNKEIEIFPRISYDYGALEHLVQPASDNVYFRLYYGSVKLIEKMEVVRFHSVNEVPLAEISRFDGKSVREHSELFAAYVNEDDPVIDKILKEALAIGVADKIGFENSFAFSGYQIKDDEGDSSLSVYLQVLAVWSVFLQHNIKYSDITTTSTGNEKILTQYVRTLSESFGNSQANCVDGSVLFASVLRKIGIDTFLVVVPGHMFVGYYIDENNEYFNFLETTMLGKTDISKYTDDNSFLGKLKSKTGIGNTRATAARDSFLAATEAANKEYEDVDDDDLTIINIAAARASGIMPIVRY